MDATELDIALDELETRLERLRALYEQYFLGIEKIEPSVARKDVERRIWLLRRERINNTAKRFRLQTIIQRHNTFQQHWVRICREIEAGTYQRHLARAEKIMPQQLLTIAAKRRFGKMAEARDTREAEQRHVDAMSEEDLQGLVVNGAAKPAEPDQRVLEAQRALDAALRRSPIPKLSSPPAPGVSSPPAPRADSSRPSRPDAAGPGGSAKRYAALSLDLDFGPREPSTRPSKPAQAAPPQTTARAASTNTTAQASSLTEAKISELHQKLLAAKQKTAEGGEVSPASLARSLRAAEAKLRQEHVDRRIDFDVVIKDGRAIVKPILRKPGA